MSLIPSGEYEQGKTYALFNIDRRLQKYLKNAAGQLPIFAKFPELNILNGNRFCLEPFTGYYGNRLNYKRIFNHSSETENIILTREINPDKKSPTKLHLVIDFYKGSKLLSGSWLLEEDQIEYERQLLYVGITEENEDRIVKIDDRYFLLPKYLEPQSLYSALTSDLPTMEALFQIQKIQNQAAPQTSETLYS